MSHFPTDGFFHWSHAPALVPDQYGNDGRVAEAAASDMAERRARTTMVIADATPSKLPTQIVVPRAFRRGGGA